MQVANYFLAAKKRRGSPPLQRPAQTGRLVRRQMLSQLDHQLSETSASVFPPLLSDADLAGILGMTTSWVRSHALEIPGFRRLGTYFRFCRQAVEQWLGSLDPLFDTVKVAELMLVPDSWVYAHADEIPGFLRLGRSVRFRRESIHHFLAGSEVAQ